MQSTSNALLNFTKNLDSLIIGIVLFNKSFKVVMQNTSLEIPDLNKIQFNDLYM